MAQDQIDTYREEMKRLYGLSEVVCVPLSPSPNQPMPGRNRPTPGPSNQAPGPGMPAPNPNIPMPSPNRPMPEPGNPTDESPTGGLIVSTTALRRLYPVPSARVTVFTGPYENMEVIDTGVTDESGKRKVFRLETPERSLSQSAGATKKPYALYNVFVQADGYVDTVNTNIPIFEGVTSLQNIDMILRSTAENKEGPRIIDEAESYEL